MTAIVRSMTAHAVIDKVLHDYVEYRDFRDGLVTRAYYSHWVESRFDELNELGLNRDEQNLSTRFPVNDRECVTNALAALAKGGLVPGTEYPVDVFDEFAEHVAKEWDHGGRTTFIFPEEARLMFALSHQVRPRNSVFLGSYYGYWAIWALPAVAATGGHVTLVDIDEDVMTLAERNIAALGYSDLVDFVVADASEYARTLSDDVDLCVLDAEGPLDAPDPDLRDKAIYYPHTRAISHALPQGALLVAHNVLLENLTENSYFAGRIANNKAQFAKWAEHLEEFYDVHRVSRRPKALACTGETGRRVRDSRAVHRLSRSRRVPEESAGRTRQHRHHGGNSRIGGRSPGVPHAVRDLVRTVQCAAGTPAPAGRAQGQARVLTRPRPTGRARTRSTATRRTTRCSRRICSGRCRRVRTSHQGWRPSLTSRRDCGSCKSRWHRS